MMICGAKTAKTILDVSARSSEVLRQNGAGPIFSHVSIAQQGVTFMMTCAAKCAKTASTQAMFLRGKHFLINGLGMDAPANG